MYSIFVSDKMKSLEFAAKLEAVMTGYTELLGKISQLTASYKRFLVKEGYSNEVVRSLLAASRISLRNNVASSDAVSANIVSANELNKNLKWYKELDEELAICEIAFIPEDSRCRGYLFKNPRLSARNGDFFIGGDPGVGVYASDKWHCETAQFTSKGESRRIEPTDSPLTSPTDVWNYLRNEKFDDRVIRAVVKFDEYALLPSSMDHPTGESAGKVVLLQDIAPKCTS